MNARNITIVNSRTQSTKTISSSATTLGQLRSDLRNAGFDYNGLAFFEEFPRLPSMTMLLSFLLTCPIVQDN